MHNTDKTDKKPIGNISHSIGVTFIKSLQVDLLELNIKLPLATVQPNLFIIFTN